MAGEWSKVQIGALGRVVTGRTPPGNDPTYYNGTVPFLTPSDIATQRRVESTARSLSSFGAAQLARCLVPRGVGVSCIGWQMGKAVLIDRPTITNQQINSIIVDENIADPLFVYYSLAARRSELFNLGAGGSRTPILNKGDFERLPFILPSLQEQRAIAHILGTLDDKIELKGRMNETIESMARALFKSWFVDFDPVRAKAEGRDPGLPEHLADLFPDSFVGTELGEIPSGWEVTRLGQIAQIQGGKQLPASEYCPLGSYPVFGANGIMGFAERSTHERFVIAFGRVGAYCGSVHWSYSGAWINNNASSVLPTGWPEFVLQAMLTVDFSVLRTGSAQPFIPNGSLSSMQILRPSDKVLEAFCSVASRLRWREHELQAAAGTLATLRDTLIPKLISGELRLANAEKSIGKVV